MTKRSTFCALSTRTDNFLKIFCRFRIALRWQLRNLDNFAKITVHGRSSFTFKHLKRCSVMPRISKRPQNARFNNQIDHHVCSACCSKACELFYLLCGKPGRIEAYCHRGDTQEYKFQSCLHTTDSFSTQFTLPIIRGRWYSVRSWVYILFRSIDFYSWSHTQSLIQYKQSLILCKQSLILSKVDCWNFFNRVHRSGCSEIRREPFSNISNAATAPLANNFLIPKVFQVLVQQGDFLWPLFFALARSKLLDLIFP